MKQKITEITNFAYEVLLSAFVCYYTLSTIQLF